MEGKENRIGSIIIVVTYAVGILGFALDLTKEIFSFLVPFHLLMVFGILLWEHKHWDLRFILFLILTFFISFSAEFIGVHTGILFGDYNYGNVLGFKIGEVPIMIGINWIMLVYITNSISEKITKNFFYSTLLAASIMTFLDYVMEPGAVLLDFWSWEIGIIPFYNYVCWFILSLGLIFMAKILKVESNVKLSTVSIISQFVFFLALRLY